VSAGQVVVRVVDEGANWLTLTVAVAGVLLAATSLIWQWLSYRLGGPRLTVSLRIGYYEPGQGQLVSSSVSGGDLLDAQMAAQGLTVKLLGVEVLNVGRMPITIDTAQAMCESGVAFSEVGGAWNPPSGSRLEPHSSQSWWVQWDQVLRMVTASSAIPKWNRPQKVWMELRAATRKSIRTKESVSVAPVR
jgi:hypothetical protein